jgi:hypothetical protein
MMIKNYHQQQQFLCKATKVINNFLDERYVVVFQV